MVSVKSNMKRDLSTRQTSYVRTNADGDLEHVPVVAIGSGISGNAAIVTDHGALTVRVHPEGLSAFGETITVEPTAVMQLQWHYNINPRMTDEYTNNLGSLTHANNMVEVHSGASANSAAYMRSHRRIPYHAGQGILTRFSAIFDTPAAGNTQIVGIGDQSDGFFFGYNGTSFGVLHRRGGEREIQYLTVSTASSTAENITITLNGDADATVAVTASGNITTTVNEIAAHDYSDVGDGWTAYAEGNRVYFLSYTDGAKSGSYTLSGASTAVGTFTAVNTGATATENWVPQASWNGDDIFDGNGTSGVTLDPTQGNVYQIRYQWLGFGAISFFLEDPDDGEMHLVHTLSWGNANTVPSVLNPEFPLTVSSINVANTSDVVVRSASMAAFVEGKNVLLGPKQTITNTKTTVSAANTPVLAVRNKIDYQGVLNRTETYMVNLSAAVEHTKPVRVDFYLNPTLTDASWSDVSTNTSILKKDTSSTAMSGGTLLFSIPLGKSDSDTRNLDSDQLVLIMEPGDVIVGVATPNSGTNAEVTINMTFVEEL